MIPGKRRIFLVEDDPEQVKIVLHSLGDSYEIITCAEGKQALDKILTEKFDLIVLDIILPKLDGFAILYRLRAKGFKTPVLVMTDIAKSVNSSKTELESYKLGATIFHPKPLSLDLFLAQVNSLLKLTDINREITISKLAIDPVHKTVKFNNQSLHLTSKEFALLHALATSINGSLSRDEILKIISTRPGEIQANSVDTLVSRLRSKFKKAELPALVLTAYGRGYRINKDI